jgi:hypothetical protein
MCIHCVETYERHDPAPRLLVSQARLLPAISTPNATVGQTTWTAATATLPFPTLPLITDADNVFAMLC